EGNIMNKRRPLSNKKEIREKRNTSDNEGLVATSWKDRAPFTAVLMEILRYWPHSPSMLHSLSRGELKGEFESECWFLCLEDIASKFYCQTFWNYFGRAPILPRRIR